ncbi:MAG: hypothetical protein IRY98_05725 [Alicyclobacillaceae bacterium]|nr:hypothetical protein [Alicyclobacillaceae bacterium]
MDWLSWISLIFLGAGIVLLALEMVFVSGGILGTLGILAVGASVVAALAGAQYALASLGAGAFLVAVGAIFALRYYGKRGLWNRIVLGDRQETQAGYTPTRDLRYLVGRTGRAVTPLRPAGIGEFADERVDVVSEGEFIERGASIEVVAVEGRRVVVRRAAGFVSRPAGDSVSRDEGVLDR